jgi:hypothetical protein
VRSLWVEEETRAACIAEFNRRLALSNIEHGRQPVARTTGNEPVQTRDGRWIKRVLFWNEKEA